jgi:ABC-type dipeptide/oligopeptide/nickel transport system ATPase subunit
MNIKLHTPNSLKSGSGISSFKQFLMSVVATSVSIALTFGTAAVIDSNKKQKEKREIVMVLMYDMYNSLHNVEQADSMVRHAMDLQLQLAEDPSQFERINQEMLMSLPLVEYTEAAERIFSSSIETINTVGNVLFTEDVAEFYQCRHKYKTLVSDSLTSNASVEAISSVRGALDFNLWNYAIMSVGLASNMKLLFNECKQMMNVTDKDLEAYRREKTKMENDAAEVNEHKMAVFEELRKLQEDINKAKSKTK